MISTAMLKKYKISHAIIEKIHKTINKKIYIATPLSRRIIGTVVSQTGVSFYDAEILFSAAIRCFLDDVGLGGESQNKKIAESCTPCRATIGKYIDETAAEKLAWLRQKVEDKLLYLSCDKGHKKGIGHFVKYISFYDDIQDKVVKYLLDSEASGGATSDCAIGIDFSFTRLDKTNVRTKVSGQCTDAGGGGVGENLKNELVKVDRVLNPDTYLAPTCSLHGHQLNLSNPTKKLIGDGGLGTQNVLQLLHSLYNL